MKSASEPTLAAAMEHLLRSIDASTDDIHPPLAARMIAVANGPDGGRILRWWREQAKLVTPRPPYWNICGRVACGEIGDPVS